MSKHKTLRLDDGLLERIEAIATEYGMEFSAAMRWALKRGVTAIEEQTKTDKGAAAPRRRVLSPGVG
jgi:antitoxin component of RelBE/YafQ-DinJ toxin-antitoxin module